MSQSCSAFILKDSQTCRDGIDISASMRKLVVLGCAQWSKELFVFLFPPVLDAVAL